LYHGDKITLSRVPSLKNTVYVNALGVPVPVDFEKGFVVLQELINFHVDKRNQPAHAVG
jgi:hypothetical protein